MGGWLSDGEPFDKFFNRAASAIRSAMSSFVGDELARKIHDTFALLGNRTSLNEFNVP